MMEAKKKKAKIAKLLNKIKQEEVEVQEQASSQIVVNQFISDSQFWQLPVYIDYHNYAKNNNVKQIQQCDAQQGGCQKKISFDQNNQFYCSRCDKQFESSQRALFHKIKAHNDTSDIKLCEYCNNSYYSHFRLLMHQFRDHSDKMNQDIKNDQSL
ncbi:hypothetical protein pb186bvf_003654 [Paramecium bursaria]